MDFFEEISLAPRDPILGLNIAFKEETRPEKINAGVGTYKTDELKPHLFASVKKAEEALLRDEKSKDYLPIDGDPDYVRETNKLVFGTEAAVYGTQTVGGTGALRICAEFLRKSGFTKLYVSNPTWDNHERIFTHAGFTTETFPYYNAETRSFDLEKTIQAINTMERGSVLLLQPACHNPTGCDPSVAEWEKICQKVKEKELFILFDFAYQGFGHGVTEDAFAIRLFLQEGMQFAVCVSHSKSFGLYAERTGALFVACGLHLAEVGSQIKVIIRGIYSNPPCHGARVVKLILMNPQLKEQWLAELTSMRERISQMRMLLMEQLGATFLEKQCGMFSYIGLSAKQVDRLREEYAIYLPQDGRINVAGVNAKAVESLVTAIKRSL